MASSTFNDFKYTVKVSCRHCSNKKRTIAITKKINLLLLLRPRKNIVNKTENTPNAITKYGLANKWKFLPTNFILSP